jgi:preprotein translocase subunit YajC
MTFAQETGGGALGSLPFFLVLLVGMYLLIIRPQRSRAKQMAAVRSALGPDSQVITTAGLYARVVSVDGDTTVLEIAPGVHATFAVQAVVRVLDEPGADRDLTVDDERPDERPPL